MSCLCVERASLRGAQSELHFHILHRGSIPNDGERGLGVRRHLRHVAVQGIEGRQRLPVERDDPVSWKDACRCRRSARLHLDNFYKGARLVSKRADQVGRRRLGHAVDAHVAPLHGPVGHDLRRDELGRVDRHAEADRLRALDDRRVDPNDSPAGVHQRSARVARVQGHVGLNDVVDQPSGLGSQAAAKRGHHARADAALEAQRIADGHRHLADPQLIRVPQRKRLQAGDVVVEAQNGHIRCRVGAHNTSTCCAAVHEHDLGEFGALTSPNSSTFRRKSLTPPSFLANISPAAPRRRPPRGRCS
mmetsp:Transcript_3775/g.14786  ORF Transcript_3775/g.14786 Transcript_3775/m.14786 type:complete len:304 (-) Transcript_3775:288-1199(-)